MIDIKSSFSSKLIIDILTIKCNVKSLQDDLKPDIAQKIRNINIPKISQYEIQQIHTQSNGEQIKMLLNNIFQNFHYNTALLNDIGNYKVNNSQAINYLSLIVMYSYISWILHIKDLNTISNVKPLINALFNVTSSQYSTILMNITVSVISEFCLYDTEMNIYDIMPIIWQYVKIYNCYDLIIYIIKHILKGQNDPRFHLFMEELIILMDNYLSDDAIIQIIQQFDGGCTNFNMNSLKYLIKISNTVNSQILPTIIPFFPIAISDILKTLNPINIKKPINNLETDDCYQNSYLVIGEFEFSKVNTFPNGFNPSYSINFPKNIDLSTFFPQDLYPLFSQIAVIIQNDDILIDYFISSFFKVIDQNISTNKTEFNLSILISFLFICNEIYRNTAKTISIKPDYAFLFFQPEIFDYSMTIFNNKEDENNFTDYYQKMNTFRSISLDFILCDDGTAIENILLSNASNYPNFIAELFFRLSKMTTIFAHIIEENPKLIKTIINLAISYHHLEITIESENKEPIQNARTAIFVTLAHLFSNNNMLSLFFNDTLFLNTFFVFIFEEPIRPFILSILTLYLSRINLTLSPDVSSILYRVFNTVNLNLPDHRYILLLYDLIKSLNSGLTYRQKELLEFREITKILCQTMVKINHNESDSELSKKIFKETISFLILMSPFFEISALEIDSLITCTLTFKDKEFIISLYPIFISLLAGQSVTPNTTNFAIFQPQIFTLLIQIFSSTTKLTEILKFIYNVISFSPQNLQKCCEINLDLFILKYLENAKITGNRTDNEIQGFLDLYTLLSISHSSSQSVLSYISLLSPIDSVHVSKYHLKFIETMDQMVIESSKLPRSTFPLNGRIMHVTSSSFMSGKVDFSKIKNGFSIAFWLFVEPTIECNRIFALKLGDQIKMGICLSNNMLIIYQRENHANKTKPIIEALKSHTWTFCSFSFDLTKKLIVVTYLFKQSLNETITKNSVTFDQFKSPVDTTKSSLKLGGFYQIGSSSSSQFSTQSKQRSNSTDSSSNLNDTNNSPCCRLGSFGLYDFMDVAAFIEIARSCLINSQKLPISSIVYVNDYSEFDETVANGFVDVLACQSGVNMLLPLFLQNDMRTFDDQPFVLSLDTILSLLTNILAYSFEAQTNFFQSKGFNIIAQLLTDRWTSFFMVKTYRLLYQTLGVIQYEPLQQQLFDEVMTNFTFFQKLDPELHFRIVKLWPRLFESFSSIAQNFSSFEDLVVILRLFYWYTPIQTQYIKYVELRSERLNVEGIRKILFNLLLSYASESFLFSHFQCIIGHCLSCPEPQQVREMIQFLIDVFLETPQSIKFNVECEPLIALISYFIRFPDDTIRILVLKLFITVHRAKKISDNFFQCQIDSIVSIVSEFDLNRSLFDFLLDNLEIEPLLLNLCCYFAIRFNDASFMKIKSVNFHVSKFWAVLPLFLCIYVDLSVADFIFESGKNELCDIFIQYEIFFNRSKRFEEVFCDKLLEMSKKDPNVEDVLEVCKRIILFTASHDETTIHSNLFDVFEESEKQQKNNENIKNEAKQKIINNETKNNKDENETKEIENKNDSKNGKYENETNNDKDENETNNDKDEIKDENKIKVDKVENDKKEVENNDANVSGNENICGDCSISSFFKKELKCPQLKFHIQFDEEENWCHSKLAILCLSLFESHYFPQYLPFDLLLCSFLQAMNFDVVYDHLNCLNLNDKDISECEYVVLPLLIYHSIRKNKTDYNFINYYSTNSKQQQQNPLLLSTKYEHLVRQMIPKTYIKKMTNYYKEYHHYKKIIIDHINYMNNINMSQYVVHSYKQMSQFLERQQFQNDLNMRSWRRLWSALSVERAPWHIECNNENNKKRKFIFSRDVSACFALAPIKMLKHPPFNNSDNDNDNDNDDDIDFDVNYDDDLICYENFALNSRFSKRRGIVFDKICYLITFEEADEQKKRKKANFELYKSKILLIMLDDRLRGKVFTIPLSSLKFVFRRRKNGIHLFTEYGYSFHIEFDDDIQLNVMQLIFSNLMKCNDRAILLFQNADNKSFFKALPYLERWRSGKMSNYEYIMMLNHCSGRSFNDIGRYPIFPWILNSYETDSKSLFSSQNIRNFASLNKNGIEKNADNLMSISAVLTFLNRIEPFNFLASQFHDSKKCFSMDEMLNYARENGIEFVPEFFSMPEIVTNSPLDSQKFDLPSWSNFSPIEFTYHHRKILESPKVTSTVHNWFDYAFGSELFEGSHPPADFLDRERYTYLKERVEISIGPFNFVSGFISEEEKEPLVFKVRLLCEDGRLVQTTIDIRHFTSPDQIMGDSMVASSSSDSSIVDDSEIVCDEEKERRRSSGIYSGGYKNGFHFSFPRISDEIVPSISTHTTTATAAKDGHEKKKKAVGSSSNLASFADHISPEFGRISSLDSLKEPRPKTGREAVKQPELTIMETPLEVGKNWNISAPNVVSSINCSCASQSQSFVIACDGIFYVARGQAVTAIDLTLKKIHEVSVSGSTITTSPSNLTSTITDFSSSASTSASSFTITQSPSGDKQNLTFVSSKMAKLAKVASKGNERSLSFHGEESPRMSRSPSTSSTSSSSASPSSHHQRPRAISAASSFTSARSSSFSISSTFSMLSENSMHKISPSPSQLSSISCAAADGIWLAAGRDNASISIVCNLRSVATIQLYRSSISACAVSEVFNVLACGTVDGTLVIYTKNAGRIVKVVDIAKCIQNDSKSFDGMETFCKKNLVAGSLVPKKIVVTPSWGFIVVFCNEIVLGVLKRFICVFTINGEFVRKVDISFDIDFWYCWSSYSGFDYIVFASESGHVYVNEVFYMNNTSQSLFNCRDRVVASYFSKQTSTLILITSGGKLLFFPIVF